MQLKASIGGKTLSIQLSEPVEMERITELLTDSRLAVYQDHNPLVYKMAVQEAKLANETVHRLLSYDIPVDYFTLGEPSLDEVFLTLTHSKTREAAL